MGILWVILGAVLPTYADTAACQTDQLDSEHLMQWPAWGIGERMAVSQQLLLEESEESVGYMLLSPEHYSGNFTLKFETIILTPATVMVVGLVGKSDSHDTTFPEEYDASLTFLTQSMPFVMLPFHNAAHHRSGPFIAAFEDGQREVLAEAERITTRIDTVHLIEFGKSDEKIWLDIDGETVVTASSESVPEYARIMVRIRGTGFREAATIVRNVDLTHCQN